MELYKFNINDFTDELFAFAYENLSADKKEKVDRCKNEKNKKLMVAGDMLLKEALSEKGIALTGFYKNAKGKPYITDSPYYFNISHSEDFCICGISDKEIGVDIEKIRKANLKTTTKFATENEQKYIFGKIPDEADFSLDFNNSTFNVFERFFEIWTLKESYFKMLGTGIGTDLKSVEFSVTADGVVCNKNAKMAMNKSIDGYVISLSE